MKKIFYTIISTLVFIVCIGLIGYIGFLRTDSIENIFSIYGWCMVIYLISKTGLSLIYKPCTYAPPNLSVTVVIPVFNEDKKNLLILLEGLEQQTYPVKEIFIVDDGSDEYVLDEVLFDVCNTMTIDFAQKVKIHRLPYNQGKRFAQAYAFENSVGDIFFTMDSDGEIFPNTLYELMRPFRDRSVQAVTGHINARNRTASFLSYLLDMRYDNAFRVERASQSVTGNILVCSGPISCYRRDLVISNLDRYLTQTVLGAPSHVGDDRCLTNYAIERGKTVYQETSKCLTDVPEKIGTYFKQQTRWCKSFFRETILALKIKKPMVFLWSISEILLRVIFFAAIGYSLFFTHQSLTWGDIVFMLVLGALSAYARNSHYITKHPLCYLLAPIYGIFHFLTINIISLIALFTIRVNKWGTRTQKESKPSINVVEDAY